MVINNFFKLQEMNMVKNFASIFHTWKTAYFILIALLAMSCTEDKIGQPPTDSLPPSPLKEATVTERPGGALITYVLPNNDTDISYVRGEYEIGGEVKVVRSSVYKDFLLVEGLESNVNVTIDLYVVDHSENMSAPLTKTFTTVEAPYATIGNSIRMTPAIGGIYLFWENPEHRADIGVVLLTYDTVNKKMKEYAVTFAYECVAFFPFTGTEPIQLSAYVIDKWGHYSETFNASVAPAQEVWLDRIKMKGYALGNDAPLSNADKTNSYYSGPERLFDSIGRSLGRTGGLSESAFGIFSTEGIMPIYYTIDLGVQADVSRFWIEPRGHNTRGRYAFGRQGGASPYNWDLWGTTTDFGDSASVDFKPADDPYWTRSLWKRDQRWIYMGNYTHRRPSNPNATPDNPGAYDGDAWESDLRLTYAPPSMDNPTNFYIQVLGVGPVRYVRFEFNRSWSNESGIFMHELWFWGGIVEEVPESESD
jgi:hypothetical protein